MPSRKEQTHAKSPGKPASPPYPPVGGSGEFMGHWQTEMAELRQRVADTDQALRQALAELQDTRQQLRDARTDQAKTEAALHEIEQRFRLLGESIPFGIWISDPQGALEYASPSFLEMTQMTMEEARGLGWTRSLAPELASLFLEQWRYHTQTGQEWETEHCIRGENGERRTVLIRGRPVRDAHGRITSWVGVHLDITARKKIETSLAEHVRKLSRINAELEQFASVVSHDLRSPLTSISGCAQLLKELLPNQSDPEVTELLDNIQNSVRHMGRLIKGLLTYARLGRDGLKISQCSTQRVLTNVLSSLRAVVTETGAQITHDPLPVVQADEALLGQVFQNLLENAIKYRGQSPPVVHISARSTDSHWLFSVKDNGIGIEARHFDKIFQIFQRLHDDEHRYPGLGVGLATCKKIVEEHGGQIWLESTPGVGSIFHFSLPQPQAV